VNEYLPKIRAYLERAEQLRAIAGSLQVERARALLIECAVDYERLAATIEKIVLNAAHRGKQPATLTAVRRKP
jgi:hypothetical protein